MQSILFLILAVLIQKNIVILYTENINKQITCTTIKNIGF
ncbi:DNA repair protein [Bacillus cereus Rock4-18]|nr:DNA repair protein [Bacillus cereus Rock4-18]